MTMGSCDKYEEERELGCLFRYGCAYWWMAELEAGAAMMEETESGNVLVLGLSSLTNREKTLPEETTSVYIEQRRESIYTGL